MKLQPAEIERLDRRVQRPDHIAQRDFTPIECLPDDCLLEPCEAVPPWRHGNPASAFDTAAA